MVCYDSIYHVAKNPRFQKDDFHHRSVQLRHGQRPSTTPQQCRNNCQGGQKPSTPRPVHGKIRLQRSSWAQKQAVFPGGEANSAGFGTTFFSMNFAHLAKDGRLGLWKEVPGKSLCNVKQYSLLCFSFPDISAMNNCKFVGWHFAGPKNIPNIHSDLPIWASLMLLFPPQNQAVACSKLGNQVIFMDFRFSCSTRSGSFR